MAILFKAREHLNYMAQGCLTVSSDDGQKARASSLVSIALCVVMGVISSSQLSIAQSESELESLSGEAVPLYLPRTEEQSEFDNQSQSFVKSWQDSVPQDQYEDTDFGGLIYNEASTPTKLEMLRLLSKDTPSMMVFMTAVSMGLEIDNILEASVKYEPEKGRDLAASAVNLLPVLAESDDYVYSGYGLEDIERDDEERSYLVEDVVKRFFEKREVLQPYPDWFEGQYHFMASAAELKRLQAPQKDTRWYRSKSTDNNTSKRPIFISLYEATSSVLIDGEERITEALKNDPNAELPVVFIFNRLNERSVDELGYPGTIRGAQQAYAEKQLMLTPTPEWQLGEYHLYGAVDEFYEIFDIPEESDFEPEAWQKLLDEAENYSVTNTAFLFVVLGSPDEQEDESGEAVAKLAITTEQLYAAWDDPREESSYKYVKTKSSPPITLKNLMGKGVIFNRPDLIAALNALGVSDVPVAFYYLNSARVKPFTRGPRELIQGVIGVTIPQVPTGSTGGVICASPPCTELEQ